MIKLFCVVSTAFICYTMPSHGMNVHIVYDIDINAAGDVTYSERDDSQSDSSNTVEVESNISR